MGSKKVKKFRIFNSQMTPFFLWKGEHRIIRILKSLVLCFEVVSGLKVNWNKTHMSGISIPESDLYLLGISFQLSLTRPQRILFPLSVSNLP